MLRFLLLFTLLVPFTVTAETLEFSNGSDQLVGQYLDAS